MALTLPGDFSHLPPETVMDRFSQTTPPLRPEIFIQGRRRRLEARASNAEGTALSLALLWPRRSLFAGDGPSLVCDPVERALLPGNGRNSPRASPLVPCSGCQLSKVRAFAGYFAKYVGKATGVSEAYPAGSGDLRTRQLSPFRRSRWFPCLPSRFTGSAGSRESSGRIRRTKPSIGKSLPSLECGRFPVGASSA